MGLKFRLAGIVSNKCARWWGGGAIPVHGGLYLQSWKSPCLNAWKKWGRGIPVVHCKLFLWYATAKYGCGCKGILVDTSQHGHKVYCSVRWICLKRHLIVFTEGWGTGIWSHFHPSPIRWEPFASPCTIVGNYERNCEQQTKIHSAEGIGKTWCVAKSSIRSSFQSCS